MALSYDKLWILLIGKKMNKTELRAASGINTNTLAKLGKDEVVDMQSLIKICDALNVTMSEIMEYLPNNSGQDDK